MRFESARRLHRFPLATALVVGGIAANAVIGASGAHAATAISIPLRPHFNADVVVNGAPGAFDTTMDSIEGQWSFATATAASGSCDGPWLPDVALFPGTPEHPPVRLDWDNDDDGPNAWQTFHAAGSIDVNVFDLHYSELHLFATGAWETFLTVTLNYASGAPDVFAGVAFPSWFDPTPPGFYELVHGLDRARFEGDSLVCEDVDNPGILGRRFAADSSRVLVSVTLTRTDDDEGVLTVFGAAAVLAEEPTDFDLTSHFDADVIANVNPDTSCLLDNYDWEYDTIEPQKHLATQRMITCQNAGFGLPNEGVFPANADHPEFDLAYSNGDDGVNARRSFDEADSFTIDVPDGSYASLHLFGASGGGPTGISLELTYATGSPQVLPGQFPGWLDAGPFGSPDIYILGGPLRPQGSDPPFWISWNLWAHLHAIRFPVDASRELVSVTVNRPAPGVGDPATTLAILGASGVSPVAYIFADGFEWADTEAWTAAVGL